MPWEGSKQCSIHFFLQRRQLFPLFRENVRAKFVKSGHHIAFSRTDTVNFSNNSKSKGFSRIGNYQEFSWEKMQKL